MEKDGGRVEKQTKAKLCNWRFGGNVHAASGGVAYSLVYTYFDWERNYLGGHLFDDSCMGKHAGWELALSAITLVRVTSIMVMGGLNLEMFKMSDFRNVMQVLGYLNLSLILFALAIIIKLVHDAAAVIRLEKNPRAKQPRSTSVEMIYKRRPRQSVVQRQKLEDIV